MEVKSESEVAVMSDSATPWTAAYQAPLSMGFSRQDYWSGVPMPSPEWIGYPLQYSWASLVAQLVKNPPALQETWVAWVQPLGWEDALRRERLPTPVFWPEEYHGRAKSWT